MNKKSVFFMIVVGLLWLLVACQQSPTAMNSGSGVMAVNTPISDEAGVGTDGQAAITLVEQFHIALNAYDVAGMEALVSDDFSLKIVYGYGDTPVQTLPGGEAITDPVVDRAGLSDMVTMGLVPDEWQMTVSDLKVDGNRVTGQYRGAGDYVHGLGIGDEYGWMEAEVVDGRIHSIIYTDNPVFAVNATLVEQRQQEAANLEIVRRFYDEFAAGRAEVILEVHPETLTMYYAGESDEVPTQALYEDLAAIKAANPDLHAEIHDMAAAGNYVFTELTWRGTQTGELFGIRATGNPIMHNGIVVRRLQDGLIVESWEMWDDLAFMNSLGLSLSWDELVATEPAQVEETADSPDPTSPIGVYRIQLNANNPLEISAGYYRVSLFADGRYNINWAPQEQQEGMIGAQGHYTVTDNEITFTDESGFAACTEAEGISGRYRFSFLGSSLKLTVIEDTCEARVYVLSSKSLPEE